MAVWLKQGVLGAPHRKIRWAIGVLHSLHASHDEDMFITSLAEGNHIAGSLHYDDKALDMKRGTVSCQDIRIALGSGFDVIGYDVSPYRQGDDRAYVHIEYDP